MRCSILLALALASGVAADERVVVWPSGVATACVSADAANVTREVVTQESRQTLGLPQLCGSYDCRSALRTALNDLTGADANDLNSALDADLRRCASPPDTFVGMYTLIEFDVAGLDPAENSDFVQKVEEAVGKTYSWRTTGDGVAARLRRLQLASALASTVSTNVVTDLLGATITTLHFQYSFAGHDLASAVNKGVTVFSQHLKEELQLLVGSAGTVTPTNLIAHEFFNEDPDLQAEEIGSLFTSPWFWLSAVALCVYLVLMSLALAGFGPPWFKPAFACWPEVCSGGGFLLYRALFCPFVMLWHSVRIFVGTCLETYLCTMFRAECCRGVFWQPYEDPEFPPALWNMETEGDTASGGQGAGAASFARAAEIAAQYSEGAGAQLFEGDIEPGDMQQGAIGDCWLIAGLACVAERPEILQGAIRSKRVTPHGKYKFRLWNTIRGQAGTEWLNITIDDRIPVKEGTLEPLFASSDHNEMWAMLMEKAFAKMYGGYKNLEGGQMWWPISAITGNDPISIRKDGDEWKCWPSHGVLSGSVFASEITVISSDELFTLLNKLDRNGAFLSCANVTTSNPQGLIDGHAYSVLQVLTIGTSALSSEYFRLIRCRNPWGRNEWTGKWSDKSPIWNEYPYIRDRLLVDADDGSFWMQWEDWCDSWGEVQIVDCNTDINTVGIPVYDEHQKCGPVWACLKGCFNFWCCCRGFFRLYFSRRSTSDLKEMQKDLDKSCGIDQSGPYCKGLRKKPAGNSSKYRKASQGSDSESEAESEESS